METFLVKTADGCVLLVDHEIVAEVQRTVFVTNTVFVTFVYPGSEMHLPSMFSSLNEQSDYDFDVFIFNDGAKYFEKICEQFLIKLLKSDP